MKYISLIVSINNIPLFQLITKILFSFSKTFVMKVYIKNNIIFKYILHFQMFYYYSLK